MVDIQPKQFEANLPEGRIRELERRLAESEANLRAVVSQQIDAVLISQNTIPLLLRQAQEALQRSNKDLERRVAERTAELEYELEERKRIEQALRESETRERAHVKELESLMDAVPTMIWISHDPECREMSGNRQGYEFLQMGPESNISKSASEPHLDAQPYQFMKDGCIIAPMDLPIQVAAITGKQMRDYTLDVVFDDGSVYNLLGNVNPLFDQSGNPSGAVGVFVDISELRRLQKQQLEYLTRIEMQHRLIEQREQDRLAIARNIHDGPVQNLTSMMFNAQIAKEEITDPQVREQVNEMVQNVKQALQELRHLIFEIRPPSVIRFGLARAIQFHAEELKEKDIGIQLVLQLAKNGKQLSEFACLALYRIYQEAISNVLRHSGANTAWVRLDFMEDQLVLEIKDNGIGFNFDDNIRCYIDDGHFGLVGIQERVDVVGGTLKVTSAPGQGTSLLIQAPLTSLHP